MAQSVNFVRTEVSEAAKLWQIVYDCIQGQHVIKEKGVEYLPKPNAADTSAENSARYVAYKKRALFYEAPGRTMVGMVGQVLAKDPQFVVPPLLAAMQTSMDGQGSTVIQMAKKILTELMQSGRGGLMADFPSKEDGTEVTIKDLQEKAIAPFLRFYKATHITNWKVGVRNSVKYLRLVVLKEDNEEDDDGEFGVKMVTRYRVLKVTDAGVTSRVFEATTGENTWRVKSEVIMKDKAGKPLESLPFSFIGAENNDPEIGPSPLLGLCRIALGHYRNSADAEDSAYMVGQPTPVFSGLTEDWVANVLKNRVELGSRAAVFLPENATAQLLQAEENNLPMALMEKKEMQMIAMGANLVADKKVQQTATQSSIEANADLSILSSIVHNINSALAFTMPICLSFVSDEKPTEETLLFELNTDFDMSRMDAAGRMQLITEWQAGAIDYEEVRYNLKRIGVAYKDDTKVADAVAAEMDHKMKMQADAMKQAEENADTPPEEK